MSANMDIDVPGSLASTVLISTVVVVIAVALIVTIHICTRRRRSRRAKAEGIDRRWINEVQYEIGVPALVHVREERQAWPRWLERGEFVDFDYLSEWRGRVQREEGMGRSGSVSSGAASELEVEVEGGGRAWYSRPVGGKYDDADVDLWGRVRWVGFGRGWGGGEVDGGEGSFGSGA